MRSLISVLFLSALALAQTAPPVPATEQAFAAGVNLVQVDAVVTDSKGKLVTDLVAEEFEVYEGGKRQQVTHASFISIVPESTSQEPVVVRPQESGQPAPPPLPTRLRPEQLRRTMAVVVDDLGLSFQSIDRVRRALRKLVDTEMQPGDLVAILRTGGSIGAFSQFTNDKRMLHAAIEGIKWNIMGRSEIDSVPAPPLSADLVDERRADPARTRGLLIGTLDAIRHVVDGVKNLPGRKSVVLFSDSMSLHEGGGRGLAAPVDQQVTDRLQALTEHANRAFVVIYAVDPRGLEALQLTAADGLPEPHQDRSRRLEFQRSKEGQALLARETGGLSFENSNDIAEGIRQALEDQKGYYLVGYDPDANTSLSKTGKPKRRNIEVRVRRPGMKVRWRRGTLGTLGAPSPPPPATKRAQMVAAVSSPFTTGEIRTRLTGLFSNMAKGAEAARKENEGSFINTLFHIDGRDLTFVDETDAQDGSVWKKAVVDVLLITFGHQGLAEDASEKTFTIRAKGEAYEDALRNGFVSTMEHPVRKPGAHQIRAVVRDAASGRTGSASQFIEVPDVEKGRLVLSGVMLRSDEGAVEAGQPAPSSKGSPAQRVFRPGESLVYAYMVLNPKIDKASQQPHLEAHTVLYQDGKPIHQGKPFDVLDVDRVRDRKRIVTGGRLQLGGEMVEGDYVLQLVVTDRLVSGKHRTAAQSIDFEIER